MPTPAPFPVSAAIDTFMQAANQAAMQSAVGMGTIATQAASAVSITGGAITGLTNLGVAMSNNTAATGISLGTITDTTSRPWNIAQTWNNGSLTATLLKVIATVTSANSSSKLLDLCGGSAGTTSMFSVGLNGDVVIAGSALADRTFSFANTFTGALKATSLYGSGATAFGYGSNYALYINSNNLVWVNAVGGGEFRVGNGMNITDAGNIVLGTTTGTKIGTGTTQKLGFWNATPVAQQVLATGSGATVDNVITLLQTLGLCKQS